MSKISLYERFNEKCEEFCKDVISTFPDVEHFRHLRSGLNIVKNIDLKSPQRIFHNYIYNTPYKEYILTRNEQFFMTNQDFNLQTSKKEYWEEFINTLRSMWKNLREDDKDIVWKYFHILVILSEKCQS